MSRIHETEVFVQVVQEGSLTAASRKLGVTASYASKLVTRLEERLGAPLLIRSTRRLTLTDAGRAYYERCAELLRGLEDAGAQASDLQRTPTGTLRVTVPAVLGSDFLAEALARFQDRHPQLRLEIAFLDRRVDILDEGYDVAIRVGAVGDDQLIARKLATIERIVYGSPAYLERAGIPTTPEALAGHACLLYAYHAAPTHWRMRGPEGEREVEVTGRMVANHGRMLVEAAARGLGLIFVPSIHVAAQLQSGRLRRALAGWSLPLDVHAVYPPTSRVSAKVRLFVDDMLERMREPPWTDAAG